MPFIASLGRLTPELSLSDRYVFLTISFKRQLTSTISVTAFWIFFGVLFLYGIFNAISGKAIPVPLIGDLYQKIKHSYSFNIRLKKEEE